MVLTWKTKKGKTSKFMDAGDYNRNERERERERGIRDLERVDRDGRKKGIKL